LVDIFTILWQDNEVLLAYIVSSELDQLKLNSVKNGSQIG